MLDNALHRARSGGVFNIDGDSESYRIESGISWQTFAVSEGSYCTYTEAYVLATGEYLELSLSDANWVGCWDGTTCYAFRCNPGAA